MFDEFHFIYNIQSVQIIKGMKRVNNTSQYSSVDSSSCKITAPALNTLH